MRYTCVVKGCNNPTDAMQCSECLRKGADAPAHGNVVNPSEGAMTPVRTTGTGPSKGADAPGPKRKKPERKEDEIRTAIKNWYRLKGAAVWDTEQGWRNPKCRNCGFMTSHGTSRVDKGLPDLIVLWPGRGVRFVETKSDVGRQTPEQKEFQRQCELAGDLYILVRTLDDLISLESSGAPA